MSNCLGMLAKLVSELTLIIVTKQARESFSKYLGQRIPPSIFSWHRLPLAGADNTSFAYTKEVFKKIHRKWWPLRFPRIPLNYATLRNSLGSNRTLLGRLLLATTPQYLMKFSTLNFWRAL